MIWVALIGLPVLVIANIVMLLVVGSPEFIEYSEHQEMPPGKQWMYVLPVSISLFVLCSSFVVHLMEVL